MNHVSESNHALPTASDNNNALVHAEARLQGSASLAISSASLSTQISKPIKPALAQGTVASISRKPQNNAVFRAQAHQFSVLPINHRDNWLLTLPILHTKPIPVSTQSPPVVVGEFVLYPDKDEAIAYYTLAQPRIVDTDLVVERNSEFRVTGGTATMIISCFPAEDSTALVRYHSSWQKALGSPNKQRAWRFQPLPLQRLKADLDIPSTHERLAPGITENRTLGAATFLLELSALGAESWRQAIAQGTAVIGVASLGISYAGKNSAGRIAYQSRNLNASLSTLLAAVNESSIRVVDPQVEVATMLVISGHPSIANVSVELRSSFSPVHTQIFDGSGGSASLTLTATDLSAHYVEWHVVVNFLVDDWPTIRVSGVLSQDTGWSELLSPSSWMRELTITSLLVDTDGRVLDNANSSDRVTGTLAIQADFIDNPSGLQTTFETHSEQMSRVVIPQPPGESAASVHLSVFALRDGLSEMTNRAIAVNENWVVITVTPEPAILLATNTTPVSENSATSTVANELSRLTENSQLPTVQPRLYTSRRRSTKAAAPVFTLAESTKRFWALEIASHPALLPDSGATGRTLFNYWFSYGAMTTQFIDSNRFQLPAEIWQRMAKPGRLYYRAYLSETANEWSEPQVTTADVLIDEAPYLEVFDRQ